MLLKNNINNIMYYYTFIHVLYNIHIIYTLKTNINIFLF